MSLFFRLHTLLIFLFIDHFLLNLHRVSAHFLEKWHHFISSKILLYFRVRVWVRLELGPVLAEIRFWSSEFSSKCRRSFILTPFPCPFLAKPHPFCPNRDRSIINKQGCGLERKGTWKRGNCTVIMEQFWLILFSLFFVFKFYDVLKRFIFRLKYE